MSKLSPEWLLDGPAETNPGVGMGHWISEALEAPESVLPGSQHDVLRNLCFWAAGHLEPDIAEAILSSWAQRLPLTGRPWTHEDVRTRLDSAYAKRVPDAGRAGPLVDGATGTGQSPSRTLKARTFKEFVEETETSPELDWFIEDMVAPGCWTELVGRMKEGKSTFVMGMLAAMLDGSPFLGRKTRKTKVLYLTEQVGRSFEATVRRGGLQKSDEMFVLTIAETFTLTWADVARQSIEAAKQEGCGIIVVDTLSGMAQLEDEDIASSVSYLNALHGARAANIAILFTRHGRKSGGAINVAGRGSGAITGAMDICLRLDAPNGVSSPYRYLEIISRLSGASDAHLCYEGGTYILGESPEATKAAARVNPIIALLSSNGPKGATAEQVAEEIKVDLRTAQRRLTALLDDGKIRSTRDENDERRVRYILATVVQ